MPRGWAPFKRLRLGRANIGFGVWHRRFNMDVLHLPSIFICIRYDRSYYKGATHIFGNTIHHCRNFCLWYLLPFTKQVGYLSSNKLFSEDYLWFALSFNGIRPWQPWSCYAVCFSHNLFARPADQNASFVMAVLTPTFHAIQIRLRVFVALQNGPAYRIVYVLLPRSHAMLVISILLADPALIVSGILTSAHISALNRVSGWPAKWINCCTRA